MYRKMASFLALIILSNPACAETYECEDASGSISLSGAPCEGGSAFETMSGQDRSDSGARPESGTSDRDAYTKDSTPMRSPDVATQACFDHMNTTARFPDPSSTKLLSSTKRWVTVKDVGGRQMVTIGVTSKNEAGMYLGIRSFDCLLMGDNATVNTGAYELL